jgi:chemotaxis protein methyltransferase WspC
MSLVFEDVLRDAIGLDPASIGSSAVGRAVQTRQRACGLSGADYLARVRESGAELQALIDEVVVPETWFFREPQAFEMLADFVCEDWLPAHPGPTDAGRPLRVLSLPSSTGEEPYSIAMTLLADGVPADRFRVDGIDVSDRALLRAVEGVYGRNSFRGGFGLGLGLGAHYFTGEAGARRVTAEVRQQVQFRNGNICTPGSLPGAATYDVIFCRNLLIYFDRPTQDRALDVIERLLTPDGLLFVAPSETSLLLGRAAGWTKTAKGFGFRPPSPPSAATAGKPAPTRRAPVAPTRIPIAPTGVRFAPTSVKIAPTSVGLAPTREPNECPLEEATRLADQGRFAEAVVKCDEHLRLHGPSAPVFQLLGVLHDAGGDTDGAIVCYRKSLYLDPHNQEVLIHLRLLLQKLDKKQEAGVLRDRERRVAERAGART